jgi:hypothetical protein
LAFNSFPTLFFLDPATNPFYFATMNLIHLSTALVLEQANYFGSLPHRKNSHRKPIRRSISDASKKSKRNSIFNIFNSTPIATSTNSPVINKKTINEKHATNKKVERSKSDVSSRTSKGEKSRNPIHLNVNSFNNNLTNSSDSSDNNTAFSTSTPKHHKAPLSPITEVNSPFSDINSRTDYFDEEPIKSSKLTNGTEFVSTENLDLIPTTDNMSSKYSKSVETMHSSQLPVEKPALTKGAAVNKMIKRLSIEKLSPPPTVIQQAGGFSYTNPTSPLAYSPTKILPLSPPLTKSDQPSSDIVYAQVVCNDGSKKSSSKETVQNTLKKNRHASPPSSNLFEKSFDSVDNFVTTASSPVKGNNSYQFRNSVKIVTDYDQDEVDNAVTDDEPFIKPNIRYTAPRYTSNTNINNNNFINEFENHYEMRDNDFDGLDMTLSSRREILESRIKSRIGGLQVHHNNDNGKAFVQTQNHIRRTSSPPPTTTKRYHKYGSNEIINRYSPERSHVELIQSRSPSYERQSKNYADSTLRKKSHYYSKHDKGDSGIEVDNVTKNNKKNKYSSRFNIG